MDQPKPPYPAVESRPNFPGIERSILQRWAAEHTFEASIEERSSDSEYVFYDGPPFANGLPHYGHLLTGYVKDVVPRYQTMRGTTCLLYTSPSPRDRTRSRMPSSA